MMAFRASGRCVASVLGRGAGVVSASVSAAPAFAATAALPVKRAAAVPSFSFATTTSAAAFAPVVAVPRACFAKKVDKDDGKNKGGKGGKGGAAAAAGDADAAPGTYGVDAEAFKAQMQAQVERLNTDLAAVKVGRPSPEQLADVSVDVGAGKRAPLSSLAQIYLKPPQTLVVVLYEPSAALETATCQAVAACGLDLSPMPEQVNGAPAIVVPFPKPTKELRDALAKQAKARGEDCKTALRGVRKAWMDKIKKQAPPKDDARRFETDCQKATDAATDAVTKAVADKEKQIAAA